MNPGIDVRVTRRRPGEKHIHLLKGGNETCRLTNLQTRPAVGGTGKVFSAGDEVPDERDEGEADEHD